MSRWKVISIHSVPTADSVLRNWWDKASEWGFWKWSPNDVGVHETDVLNAPFNTAVVVASDFWDSDSYPSNWWRLSRTPCVVSDGKRYIYYVKPKTLNMVVCEYDIETETTNQITAYTSPADDDRIYNTRICFVSERKVLAICDNDYDWGKVYLVDFDTDTVSVDDEYYYPQELLSWKKSDGTLVLFSFGYNFNWCIRYKIYPTSESWTEIDLQQSSYGMQTAPAFLGDKYLCWMETNYIDTSHREIVAYTLNLDDFTMSYSTPIGSGRNGSPITRYGCQSVGASYTNKKIYGAGTGFYFYSTPPVYWKDVFEFDPSTGDISRIHYEESTSEAGEIVSSPNDAYLFDDNDNTFYVLPSFDAVTSASGIFAHKKDANGFITWNGNTISCGTSSATIFSPNVESQLSRVGVYHAGKFIVASCISEWQRPASTYTELTFKVYLLKTT